MNDRTGAAQIAVPVMVGKVRVGEVHVFLTSTAGLTRSEARMLTRQVAELLGKSIPTVINRRPKPEGEPES